MRRKQPYTLVAVASFTSLGLLLATPLWAWDGVVEKQTRALPLRAARQFPT